MNQIHAIARSVYRLFPAAAVMLVCWPATAVRASDGEDVTLELIMAHPDWLGNAPENPYWSDDGTAFYYSRKRAGEEHRDLIRVSVADGASRVVSDAEMGEVDVRRGDWSRDYSRKVYTRNGDLFIKDMQTGTIRQLTRTSESESAPRFMADEQRIMYRRGGVVLVRELDTGFEYQPADLRLKESPHDEPKDKFEYLKDQQRRLFNNVRERKRKRDAARERTREARRADPTRVPAPWYLGDDITIRDRSLSPDGQWMLLRVVPKKKKPGKADNMPNYAAESGYVSSREVRSKVGTGQRAGERLLLLDLRSHEKHELDLSVLPGIADDPLEELREKAEAARKHKTSDVTPSTQPSTRPATQPSTQPSKKKPKPRSVRVAPVWNRDGTRLVLQCFSLDSKDRWIVAVDLEEKKLVALERMSDEAWINRRFTTLNWLRDDETIYYVSERDGYGHLYVRRAEPDARARQLTRGEHEVSNVRLSRDGRFFHYRANVRHPGIYEAYRVRIAGGSREQLTRMGGRNRAVLSPDETQLLITHSSAARPPELYVQLAAADAEPQRMTNTISERFAAIAWVEPEIIEIRSRSGRPIYARVYTPPRVGPRGAGGRSGRRPAVMFVHGAGYLQNAHHGWSHYFREFMFHTLLVGRGYVVLDMDYRASAGYGRDWRTAIYRQMGTPELEDLADGVKWLVRNKNVDGKRVGVYGGSYGGFLTLMALFREPELFACGAALRPVTDWAHYNHGYTANILNTPTIDPEAYERSSPIEFAEGLSKPLLMCHGMQDDNVFFQDTVRLAQRLIELGKRDWEVAMYPIEPHGFREPASWLDEYRRILKLFERHLK